jgi:hypothetical protein
MSNWRYADATNRAVTRLLPNGYTESILASELSADVTPDPYIPPQPTQATLSAAVQAHLDATARARSYDSALSCVSYIDSTVTTYRAEAAAMRDWRDAVWTRCYELLAEVQAGTRPIPTESELIALLPAIQWGAA